MRLPSCGLPTRHLLWICGSDIVWAPSFPVVLTRRRPIDNWCPEPRDAYLFCRRRRNLPHETVTSRNKREYSSMDSPLLSKQNRYKVLVSPWKPALRIKLNELRSMKTTSCLYFTRGNSCRGGTSNQEVNWRCRVDAGQLSKSALISVNQHNLLHQNSMTAINLAWILQEIISNHDVGGEFGLDLLLFTSFWALGIVLGHLSLAGFSIHTPSRFQWPNSQSYDFSCLNPSKILKSLVVPQMYLLMRYCWWCLLGYSHRFWDLKWA